MPIARARIALCAALGLLGPAAIAHAAGADQTVADILKSTRPVLSGVDYDTPTDPAALAACVREDIPPGRSGGMAKGYAVVIRDGQGRTLRRFVDVNGDVQIDVWSYYKDGFEVYRDIDYTFDKRVDESRWLNTAGTRIAVVKSLEGPDGQLHPKIVSWRRISGQEASLVLVEALVRRDLELLSTVMATPEELADLGLPAGLVDQAKAEAAARSKAVEELNRKLAGWGWTNTTQWLRFDADMPHTIPADASAGLKDDLLLFENAVIFAGPPDGTGDLGRIAYLQVPELLQVGDAWKFIGLPRAFSPDPAEAEVMAAFDGVRSWLYRAGSGPAVAANVSPELEAALRDLATFDEQAAKVFESGDAKALANYHYQRVKKLEAVARAAAGDDKVEFQKEIVNSLAAAYQTGEYPPAKEALQSIIKGGGPLASYAAFRLIPAEYSIRARDADEVVNAQKAWLADLQKFIDTYPKADEVPEALFQIASIKEYNGDEDEARTTYGRLAKEYAQTPSGRKAAGALRRLDLEGKPLELTGPGPDGQPIDANATKGKHLLVVFGAGNSSPTRRELPELSQLYERRKDDLAIIGVSLDADPAASSAFAQQSPWPTIVEPGGMDGRLAEGFGIISLPTMILVDEDGKVVDNDVRSIAEVEGLLDGAVAQKPEE